MTKGYVGDRKGARGGELSRQRACMWLLLEGRGMAAQGHRQEVESGLLTHCVPGQVT